LFILKVPIFISLAAFTVLVSPCLPSDIDLIVPSGLKSILSPPPLIVAA